jgi:transglutaminase-like putative cysteine protease
MYDIRQFRPTLYVLLLMGISGFALAAQSPGVWVLATGTLLLNWWLVQTGRFSPLPRWIANTVTFLAMLYAARELLLSGRSGAVLAIGEFLIFLQVVKIYEYRGNRDAAQLLVLSLLLMVSAAISTASLAYGLLLMVYLFLSLYCCLLFHLKMESEAAAAALASTQVTVNPATLRQDQRFLSSSMRRLTILVAGVSIAAAVIVFVFFPRMAGAGLLGDMQFRPSETMTGFSDKVSFEDVANISRNDDKVADVQVRHNTQLVSGTQVLFLRGVTLNTYLARDPQTGQSWSWARFPDTMYLSSPQSAEAGLNTPLRTPTSKDVWTQTIWLRPTGTDVLFSIGCPHDLTASRELKNLQVCWYDQTIKASSEQLLQPLRYTVEASPAPTVSGEADEQPPIPHSDIDPRIAALARRPGVSGADAQGPFAARRPVHDPPGPLDLKIAASIESYLRRNYIYTLDLTPLRQFNGQDPLVSFLFKVKRGHCEFFAGAMTVMCQSLGLQARMVLGFKCDEYNDIGHYYIVRQSQAHAWVEVLGPDGIWHTFDPTSANDAGVMRKSTLLTRAEHLLDYLEYTWASNVVAYDSTARTNLLTVASNRLDAARGQSADLLATLRQKLTPDYLSKVSSNVLSITIYVMVFAMFAAVGYFVFERWRLRQRARRIGLDSLPTSDQLRLARQLGFYANMMAFLQARNITRQPHQTPMEFAQSLSFLPAEAYDLIQRMTHIFYRIRYGQARLSAAQQRRLAAALEQLRQCLAIMRNPHRPFGH